MGPGLISGEAAAKAALFLIRRGFRYVPVTYTGIALVNYFKFAWFTTPAGVPVGWLRGSVERLSRRSARRLDAWETARGRPTPESKAD